MYVKIANGVNRVSSTADSILTKYRPLQRVNTCRTGDCFNQDPVIVTITGKNLYDCIIAASALDWRRFAAHSEQIPNAVMH